MPILKTFVDLRSISAAISMAALSLSRLDHLAPLKPDPTISYPLTRLSVLHQGRAHSRRECSHEARVSGLLRALTSARRNALAESRFFDLCVKSALRF
jgi:hypothetical protein